VATSRSGRRSVALWVAGCTAILVVVAFSGLGGTVPEHAVRQAGHWVYNSTLGAAIHVNGASKNVDSKVSLPGLGPANQVTQDDQHGYVIDRRNGRIVVFGKSTLAVESTLSVGTTEKPLVLEVPGGPYLVYRQRGTIVRLGQPTVTVTAGGPLDTPVATTDGTVWAQRPDNGSVCQLAPRANKLSCPNRIPAGHHGTLTTLDDKPAFTDLSAGTIAPVTAHGLGPATPLAGTAASADAHVADADAGGRLPVLRSGPGQQGTSLVLADTSTVGTDRPAATPITVSLGAGQYDTPVTSGGAVIVINKTSRTIVTYDNAGVQRQRVTVPAAEGTLDISRSQDGRVYIDNQAGNRTYVVDGSGAVTSVDNNDTSGAAVGPGEASQTPRTTSTPSTAPTAAADGPDLAACADGRCEIIVHPGTVIPLPPAMRLANLTVTGIAPTKLSLSGKSDGSGTDVQCLNSCTLTSTTDGPFTVGLSNIGILIANGVRLTVENVLKGTAILRVEPSGR
jgi:hypothetical protein